MELSRIERLPREDLLPGVLSCLGARDLGALTCAGSAILRGAVCTAWRVLLDREYPGVAAAPGRAAAALQRQVLAAARARQKQAAAAAARLRGYYKTDLRTARAETVHASVLAAMRAHGADAAVQRYGCYVLWRLAIGSDKDAVVAAGGIEVVLAAMRAHPGDAVAQANASCALRHLVAHAPLMQDLAAIAAAGGVAAVRAAMRAHAAEAAVAMPFVNPIRLAPLIRGAACEDRNQALKKLQGYFARRCKLHT
jgi:hypothetical protein